MKKFKLIYQQGQKIADLLNHHHGKASNGDVAFYLKQTLKEYSKGVPLELVVTRRAPSLKGSAIIDIEQSADQALRGIVCFEYSAWLIERSLVSSGAPIPAPLDAIRRKQNLDNYEIKKGPWALDKETVCEKV